MISIWNLKTKWKAKTLWRRALQELETDGRTDGHDDRTGSECFPCRWPEINKEIKAWNKRIMNYVIISSTSFQGFLLFWYREGSTLGTRLVISCAHILRLILNTRRWEIQYKGCIINCKCDILKNLELNIS